MISSIIVGGFIVFLFAFWGFSSGPAKYETSICRKYPYKKMCGMLDEEIKNFAKKRDEELTKEISK